LLLFGERALAIQDSEDKVLFGPVGIGVGEGARRHSTSSTTIASVR
jgi:hypothetical protein